MALVSWPHILGRETDSNTNREGSATQERINNLKKMIFFLLRYRLKTNRYSIFKMLARKFYLCGVMNSFWWRYLYSAMDQLGFSYRLPFFR